MTGGRRVDETKVPYTLDEGPSARAAIGVIVLATDQVLEHEWRQIVTQPGVASYVSRLPSSPFVDARSLSSIEPDIAHAAGLLVPDHRLDVVAFGCTSASVVIGEEKVFQHIRAVRPGIACTTPMTAAIEALRALGAGKVTLITPYVTSINEMTTAHLQACGIGVTRVITFGDGDDNTTARIDRNSLLSTVLEHGRADSSDAVLVSCTNLRMVNLIRIAEEAIGKPVISSNSAMAWHALRLAHVSEKQPQFGQLFRHLRVRC